MSRAAVTEWRQEDTKALLPPGVWQDEPDKVQWVDEDTDLDCLMVRGPMGGWCGYVGVPPGHPGHGYDYNDLVPIAVHGGLTYAGLCQEDEERGEAYGVCHTPLPGREPEVWWFGFDNGHWRDYLPTMHHPDVPGRTDDVKEAYAGIVRIAEADGGLHYWTYEEVTAEVTHLASQLGKMK